MLDSILLLQLLIIAYNCDISLDFIASNLTVITWNICDILFGLIFFGVLILLYGPWKKVGGARMCLGPSQQNSSVDGFSLKAKKLSEMFQMFCWGYFFGLSLLQYCTDSVLRADMGDGEGVKKVLSSRIFINSGAF